MSQRQSIFFIESFSGQRKQRRYTLELFRETDNGYRLIRSRFNNELGLLDEEKHTLAASKEELKRTNLGNGRLVKLLKKSEWWQNDDK